MVLLSSQPHGMSVLGAVMQASLFYVQWPPQPRVFS